MEKEAAYLSQWFVRYMKNRDLAFRRIRSVREEPGRVVVEENSGKVTYYLVVPFVKDFLAALNSVDKNYEHLGVVTYNTPEAFDSLISSWKRLVGFPSLVIYFVNPFSKLDKKWVIRPRTHNLISDDESLRLGLKSLFSSVDPVDPRELARIIA